MQPRPGGPTRIGCNASTGGTETARWRSWHWTPSCRAGSLARSSIAREPSHAVLVSMWVAPSHRRSGVGRALVCAVVDWARTKDARVIRLTVTCNNDTAIMFYRSLGLSFTGVTEPYPNDAELFEQEMRRAIRSWISIRASRAGGRLFQRPRRYSRPRRSSRRRIGSACTPTPTLRNWCGRGLKSSG